VQELILLSPSFLYVLQKLEKENKINFIKHYVIVISPVVLKNVLIFQAGIRLIRGTKSLNLGRLTGTGLDKIRLTANRKWKVRKRGSPADVTTLFGREKIRKPQIRLYICLDSPPK